MFDTLKAHAARHALTYVIALMLGFAASFTALYDNFWILSAEDGAKQRWWHWMALWAKCIAPFATTVTAYLIKSPLSDPKPPEGDTQTEGTTLTTTKTEPKP